jgi:hypothetical protein
VEQQQALFVPDSFYPDFGHAGTYHWNNKAGHRAGVQIETDRSDREELSNSLCAEKIL